MAEENIHKKVLPTAQAISLELLKLVSGLCNDNDIKYTLLYGSLWGSIEFKGFLPWTAMIQVGMFYDDFISFKEICKNAFINTGYYIVDHDNSVQFDEVYMSVAKRSRVELQEERKQDKVYYDYRINVYPIIYAGNTKKEYSQFRREFLNLYKRIHVKRIVPDTFRLKKTISMINRMNLYRRKTPNDYDELMKIVNRYKKPTKFVFILGSKKFNKIICQAELYHDLTQCQFESETVSIVKKSDIWFHEFFDEKTIKKIRSTPVNQTLLEGPEILRRVQLISLDILIEFDRICRLYDIRYNLAAGTLLGAVRHKGFVPWDDDVDIFIPYDEWCKFLKVAPEVIDTEKYFIRTQETDVDNNLVSYQIKRNDTVFCRAGRDKYNSHHGIFIDILPLFNGSKYRIYHKIHYKIGKFFRTVTWAHMGAESEHRVIKRWYYMQLKKISNKTSSNIFYKIALRVKKKTDRLTYLYAERNPFNKAFNRREAYEKLIELEFEGHKFYAPENYEEILEYCYSKDYKMYPPVSGRVAKHLPARIEVGNLHKL